MTAFQQNVRSCTKSEVEMIMEMQHTYEEQQSHMDNMIRQVALLAKMIKEVKENRAESEVNGNAEMNECGKRAGKKKLAEAEEESEALLEEVKVEEIKADEEGVQTEEKSITTPPIDDVSKENIKCKEAIEYGEEIDNTHLYLQPSIMPPDEKVEEFTSMAKEESTLAEEPPPEIDKSKGCSYEEEEPEWREERTRRKAARAIYWMQLSPWPEPERMGKPPHSGVRPKKNKKILGAYRHQWKRRGIRLKAFSKNDIEKLKLF